MESIEKLRDCTWIGGGKVNEYLDAIEREIAERYMELPVDADGVPIRIGDELCLSKLTRGEVSALRLTPDGWEWELEGDDWYDIRFTNHVNPDPVKELLEECADGYVRWMDYSGPVSGGITKDELFAKYAAEMRELLGGDGR